jgi:hypothetical protein
MISYFVTKDDFVFLAWHRRHQLCLLCIIRSLGAFNEAEGPLLPLLLWFGSKQDSVSSLLHMCVVYEHWRGGVIIVLRCAGMHQFIGGE